MNLLATGFLSTPTIQALGRNAHNEIKNLLDDLDIDGILKFICERVEGDKVDTLNRELQDHFESSDYDFVSVVREMTRCHRKKKGILDFINKDPQELNGKMLFSETFAADYQVTKVIASRLGNGSSERVEIHLNDEAKITMNRYNSMIPPYFQLDCFERRDPEEFLKSIILGRDHSYQTIRIEGKDPIFGGMTVGMNYLGFVKQKRNWNVQSSDALELYDVYKFELRDHSGSQNLQQPKNFTLTIQTDSNCTRIISVKLHDFNRQDLHFSLERLQRLTLLVSTLRRMPTEEVDSIRVKERVRSPDELKLRKLEQISKLEDDVVYLLLREPNHAVMNRLLSELLSNSSRESSEADRDTVLQKFLRQQYEREDIVPFTIRWKVRLIKFLIDSMREQSSQKAEETTELHLLLQRANYLRWLTREDSLSVMKAMELFDLAREEMAQMVGKDLVIFLGNTGAGKSTSINYYLGHRLVEAPSLGEVILKVDEQQMDAETIATKVAKIGQSLGTSETAFTKSFAIPEAVRKTLINAKVLNVDRCAMADAPGFCDTRGENYQILTMMSIQQTVQQANSIRAAVLTVPYQTLIAERGGPLVDLFRSFKEMLPGAFVRGSNASKSVYVLITKCTDPLMRERYFEDRITTLLQEDQTQLQRQTDAGASVVDLDDTKERIKLWKMLLYWSDLSTSTGGSHIIFLDTQNRIQSKSTLQAFLQSPGLQKTDVRNAFENSTLKNKLASIVNLSANTNLFIAKLFLTELPREIAAKLAVINEKEALINRQMAEQQANEVSVQLQETRIAEVREQIEQFSNTDNSDPEKQAELAELVARLRDDQFADTTQEIERCGRELQQHERKVTKIKEDIEELEVRNRRNQEEIAAKQVQIRELQEGSTKKELFRDGPHDKLRLRYWKSGAGDRALDEVRASTDDDFMEGERHEYDTATYRGTLLQHAYISKDYYIVPNDAEEQKLFVTTRQGGLYRAEIEGESYRMKAAKAAGDRRRICYQYNLTYNGNARPFFVLHHVIPNCDLNYSTVQNIMAEVEAKNATIARINADIAEHRRELIRSEKDILNLENTLKGLRESLEVTQRSAAIDMLHDSICVSESQIADLHRINAEKGQRIVEYGIEKQELSLQLRYLQTKRAQYALLVSNQRSVMISLHRLCNILLSGMTMERYNTDRTPMPSGFERQCRAYRDYINNYRDALWDQCTKCLNEYESYGLSDEDFNRLYLDDVTPQTWLDFSRTFKEPDMAVVQDLNPEIYLDQVQQIQSGAGGVDESEVVTGAQLNANADVSQDTNHLSSPPSDRYSLPQWVSGLLQLLQGAVILTSTGDEVNPTTSYQKLNADAEAKGLQIIDVTQQGNQQSHCLLEAVIDQFEVQGVLGSDGGDIFPQLLQERVLNYITVNQEAFASIISGLNSLSLESYVEQELSQGRWPEAHVIEALAKALGVTLCIYTGELVGEAVILINSTEIHDQPQLNLGRLYGRYYSLHNAAKEPEAEPSDQIPVVQLIEDPKPESDQIKSIQEPAQDPVPRPSQDPEPEPAQELEPVQHPVPGPSQDPEPEPSQDPEPEPAQEPEPEPVQHPVPGPSQDPEQEPAKEPEPEPAQDPEPEQPEIAQTPRQAEEETELQTDKQILGPVDTILAITPNDSVLDHDAELALGTAMMAAAGGLSHSAVWASELPSLPLPYVTQYHSEPTLSSLIHDALPPQPPVLSELIHSVASIASAASSKLSSNGDWVVDM